MRHFDRNRTVAERDYAHHHFCSKINPVCLTGSNESPPFRRKILGGYSTKNSGTCPKCHCSAILEIDGHAGAFGSAPLTFPSLSSHSVILLVSAQPVKFRNNQNISWSKNIFYQYSVSRSVEIFPCLLIRKDVFQVHLMSFAVLTYFPNSSIEMLFPGASPVITVYSHFALSLLRLYQNVCISSEIFHLLLYILSLFSLLR